MSGRIAKWAIELREHEVEFRGRNSVKGQILTDFLAETPSMGYREIKNEEAKRKEPCGFNTGLRIAKEMKVQELTVFVDSQLVANQVKGLFEARQPIIKQYLEKAKELLAIFPRYSIEYIKRDQNKKADALSKLASMIFSKLAKEVLVELGKLPDDPQKARKLQIKALLYKIMDGTLYRRSYLSPWLRCVGVTQAKSIIQEVHQGSCGMHACPWSVVSKIIRLGYYWPSMHKHAKSLIQRRETCQIHSLIPRKPKQEMTSIMSALPFSQ
ncbi:reverse transcriptase domain-containing protein [Tanacetum coccineum]